MTNPLRKILNFGADVPAWTEAPAAQLYNVLWSYFFSNDLYRNVQMESYRLGLPTEGTQPLRNPAFRVAEFYVAKLWTRSQDLETANDAILDPIADTWKWSNWNNKRRLAARQFAVLGDLFIKIATREGRVFFQLIDPANVTDFSTDERGFLTTCRVDVPITVTESNGSQSGQFHTEMWTKDRFRTWKHRKTPADAISKLGTPVIDIPTSEMGIDFVPIVHAKFRDVGNDRGQGAFTHALDKIDEANRMATRLHKMLFRYNSPMWTLSANAADSSGRPLPAPRLGLSTGGGADDTLLVGDDLIFRLPGNASLSALDAKIDFGASLDVLKNHMEEIEKDLPELAYYQLRQMGDISGRAVQLLLSDTIDRVLEARASVEYAVVRANQIALTMGAHTGVFTGLGGTFDDGAFDHEFVREDVFALSDVEISMGEKTKVEALTLKMALGVSQTQILTELGYNEEDQAQFLGEAQALAEAKQAAFDAGIVA